MAADDGPLRNEPHDATGYGLSFTRILRRREGTAAAAAAAAAAVRRRSTVAVRPQQFLHRRVPHRLQPGAGVPAAAAVGAPEAP